MSLDLPLLSLEMRLIKERLSNNTTAVTWGGFSSNYLLSVKLNKQLLDKMNSTIARKRHKPWIIIRIVTGSSGSVVM